MGELVGPATHTHQSRQVNALAALWILDEMKACVRMGGDALPHASGETRGGAQGA
jgi:hypothetical protein